MIDTDNRDGVLRLIARADRARRAAKPAGMLAISPPATLADDAPHLLVVDDDRRIRDLLSRFLTGEGYRVTTADNAADARAKLEGLRFDLLVLDVMMPGETGFDFAQSLRADLRRADPDADRARRRREPDQGPRDRRRRLSVEAVRAARTVAAHRQHPQARAAGGGAAGRSRCASAPSSFISARGELRKGEEVIRLTDRERDMLRVLAATPGETVPRMALAGDGGSVSERAVDVQINRLRRKIERDPANPLFVQTVRGIGYRLVISP